jgi:hypothetical protein
VLSKEYPLSTSLLRGCSQGVMLRGYSQGVLLRGYCSGGTHYFCSTQVIRVVVRSCCGVAISQCSSLAVCLMTAADPHALALALLSADVMLCDDEGHSTGALSNAGAGAGAGTVSGAGAGAGATAYESWFSLVLEASAKEGA